MFYPLAPPTHSIMSALYGRPDTSSADALFYIKPSINWYKHMNYAHYGTTHGDPNLGITNHVPLEAFIPSVMPYTVYPKKFAHGFCFAVLCCGYTLTDFPVSIRLNSLALWQSNDCPSASKATLMNMDKYFMWIHYERLHNHNKAKHNKPVCIFLGIYCILRK